MVCLKILFSYQFLLSDTILSLSKGKLPEKLKHLELESVKLQP
jgi:hypothetical protein